MSGRFVRSSKYRGARLRKVDSKSHNHCIRPESCYDNLRISKNAWDTNLVKANPHYISVNWEASGGGAFAVIPINERGRLPEQLPLFRGHTAVVLDTDWHPFNDSVIASGSDDAKVFIWKVPVGFTLHTEEGEEPHDIAPVAKLTGHSRKIGHVLFNPSAENVLASSSGDYNVKVWDVEAGSPRLTLKHKDVIQSLSWSANGSLLVTTSRDKKLRIWDVRQEKPAIEVTGHPGAKNSRVTWMGEHDKIATTGFSRMSDRQLGLWDLKNPQEPVGGFNSLDSSSGVCMPFWDDSTQCLYLAGKGDGNIRYFEFVHDRFELLSEYKSGDPQRGLAFLPKRGVNTHENEVMRAFKTVNDSYIEPISFIVPRRAEVFQDDIFPPTFGLKAAMSSAEWFDGMEGLPPRIDLASVYAGEEPTELPADYQFATRAPAANIPSTTKKAPEPEATILDSPPINRRGPPPSIKEQTSSIANLASKFADKDEIETADDDDTSSFEEVSEPIDRSEKTFAAPQEISEPTAISKGLSSPTPSQEQKPAPEPSQTAPSSSNSDPSVQPSSLASPTHATTDPSTSNPASTTQPIQGYLSEIKTLLQQQNETMKAQNEKIAALEAEVGDLKGFMGRDKDERIRELERELEGLRR